MAIKAKAGFSVAVVNDGKDGKSANTFWRYSDDNGRTFTKTKDFAENDEYGNGRNLVGFNCKLRYSHVTENKSANCFEFVKASTPSRIQNIWGNKQGKVMPAGIYRLSGLVKADTACTIVLQMGDTNVREGNIEVTTDWKPFSVTVNNTNYLNAPYYGFIDLEYPQGNSKVYIKDFMLTLGEEVYDYAPAPEDQLFGLTQGKYLGVASWDKPYPPLNSAMYQWTKVEGKDAELYKLHALEETSVVDDKGACKIVLRYEVHHVIGDFSEKYTGNDVTIKADNRVGNLNFTKKATGEWECMTTIADFAKKQLGSFNVSIQKGTQVLDTRVIPVTYATQALLEANQKLGEVVASVRSVSKLIHNLLVGSTFLEPIEGGWSMAGAKVDDALKYNNSNVVFIEEHGATQDTYHSLLFKVGGLVPNTSYTISAMVRTDNLASFTGGNNGAVLEVTQTTHGKRKRLFDPISIVPSTMNTWEKVEHTFTTPSTLTSEVVEVKFMLLRNGRLWLSQPMMNQGNMAADYTANIKDIQLSLAQIKVAANTISQSVTDLSTGLESVGIHLSGTEKKITLHGDTEIVDASGNHVAMFKDGKISIDTIDADKIVAKGIQSKTIDAKNATFENVKIKGNLDGVSGTFKQLQCIDSKGNVVATLTFSGDGKLTIESGDFQMNGTKDNRSLRFYSSDIWCRGAFGHSARTCAVIRNDTMHVYIGEKGEDGIKVKLDTAQLTSGETVYKIPLYSPGINDGLHAEGGTLVNPNDPHPAGAPIDMIVFNCSTDNLYAFTRLDEGKTWTVINGNDGQTVHIADIGGWREFAGGTTSNYFYVNPKWLNPYQANMNKLGRGVLYAGSWDSNWSA